MSSERQLYDTWFELKQVEGKASRCCNATITLETLMEQRHDGPEPAGGRMTCDACQETTHPDEPEPEPEACIGANLPAGWVDTYQGSSKEYDDEALRRFPEGVDFRRHWRDRD
jgi:hypothetical protein